MLVEFDHTIKLPCPYCHALCQFDKITNECASRNDGSAHFAFRCTYCNSIITTIWKGGHDTPLILDACYPEVDEWAPRIKLSIITNDKVKNDFLEAIKCYNGNLYNACMIMARRTIQQEMIAKNIEGENLYKQIENTGISENSKKLLHKVKNFGNHGAHSDFCLYDNDEKEIENKKGIAKLSLDFLERYFMDEYETNLLINDAPKSEKEL